MKNYKKGLLAAMILSAMSLMAAEDKNHICHYIC